jgi:pyruvate,orthophosphate dikinase
MFPGQQQLSAAGRQTVTGIPDGSPPPRIDAVKDNAAIERFRSDALSLNMPLTNVPVEIDPFFAVLETVVERYSGKKQQAHQLLIEYHHKYRNWQFVVHEAWRYAISNMRLYRAHPAAGRIVYLLSRIFLEALRDSQQPEVRTAAADHLIGFWLKLMELMPEAMARPAPDGEGPEAVARDPEGITGCHAGVLRHFVRELAALKADAFAYFMRSFHTPKQLAAECLRLYEDPTAFGELRALLMRVLQETYRTWLEVDDPCAWLEKQLDGEAAGGAWTAACDPLSHARHRLHSAALTAVTAQADDREAVAALLELPDYREIVRAYHRLPEELQAREAPDDHSHAGMLMRLKIIETKGLEAIHEEVLREINLDLGRIIRLESADLRHGFVARIFKVIEGSLRRYPEAVLQCVRTIGLEILETGDRAMTAWFLRRVIALGFQLPKIKGVSEHWQVQVNAAHILNVRIWMEFIKKKPKETKPLLSALIVNLSLGGIYIRDTDLFQKDVSQLLHSPISSTYNLIKQLAKIFPVYFNQIGAEGQLRAVSTDVDELSARGDRLIHFLRKQSHVEGNNMIVFFIEAIIHFWRTLDRTILKNYVPEEIYRAIPQSGPWVDEMQRIFVHLFEAPTLHQVKDLLDLPETSAQALIQEVPDVAERERQRALLLIRFYQLVHEKYALSFKDIEAHLLHAAQLGLPDPQELISTLQDGDPSAKLGAILDYLLALKEIILTPSDLHIIENIYHKRHIAVDIPSMYGSYNERKFDALGLTFRLENLANVLFEDIILSFDLSFITRATFFKIAKIVPLFLKALAVDGISSGRLELQADLFQKSLEIRRFSHSQYLDIFRGFSEAIQQLIHTYYNSVHEDNLVGIIKQLGEENLLPRYQREGRGEALRERLHRVSESFLRDLVARTFGLQYFDHFITSILTTLANQKEVLSAEELDVLLSYDPQKTVSMIYQPNPMTYDLIHLGNKGYNLTNLHHLTIKVPPGFVITTEYFRCRDVITGFNQANQDFVRRVMAHIHQLEEDTGRCFSCATNSLLLSVRSGSAVSMPGMMNTFLNVGINEEIVEGLIAQTGEAWFAWDNYRRFLQSWGMSSGMQRDEFDAMMYAFKQHFGCKVKREFRPEEIRRLALAYKQAILAHGIHFSDDPKEQLFIAIQQVMESWYSPKAKTYREIMGLSDKWGTAVTIQAMVYGNLDTRSGAGVMFTHDPRTSEDQIDPTGDFTLGNQGEDVVGGLVETLPLSEKQRLSDGRGKKLSLESHFPRVYRKLVDIAEELVNHQKWSPQEIEFTFQGQDEDNLYLLQTRNMITRMSRRHQVFVASKELHLSHLSSGIGVSGGALCGRVAFDLHEIQRLRSEHPQEAVILIRSDTVPDDIREISTADGILTGKGGATSHAAIVAHRLGKTCVVGCGKMRVWERDGLCTIDGHQLRAGDTISIDGRSGAVYAGCHETQWVDIIS